METPTSSSPSLSKQTSLHSKRWREQGWLFDAAVATQGIQFDQPRLGYYLGPVRDDQAHMEMHGLQSQVHKLADLTPLALGMAQRRLGLASQAKDAGHAVTASVHSYAAAQLLGLATYPIWENNDLLLDLHRRKAAAFLGWAEGVEHHVEAVDIPFRGGALPAYFHLPADHDGSPLPTIIACDGMDAGREFVVANVGDEHLRRGFAVLAIDGPGQSEAPTRGLHTSAQAWVEAGDALVKWIHDRPEVDADRVVLSGVSFGSYFMTQVAATHPGAFRACAVELPCFEPTAHTIFEQATPAYKARHMWMAGLSDDEAAFDDMVQGYDLRIVIKDMTTPWFVLGGAEDELSPASWVYELADLSPGPVHTILYDGATHALTGSPAVALGPPWRTETRDWLADAVTMDPADHPHRVHREVKRNGQVTVR